MRFRLLDISNKKNGTMTNICINKKSIKNKDLFIKIMHKYSCHCGYKKCHCEYGYFIWQQPSTINFKYISLANVRQTEKYLEEVKKEFY